MYEHTVWTHASAALVVTLRQDFYQVIMLTCVKRCCKRKFHTYARKTLHWIFLGVVLPCAAFISLNMPGTSIWHIQSVNNAKRTGKQWHSQRDAWQTFSGQQWTRNNVVCQHHSQTDFKNHAEMTSVDMGLLAAHVIFHCVNASENAFWAEAVT